MKLRILRDSIRLRLTRGEVARIADGNDVSEIACPYDADGDGTCEACDGVCRQLYELFGGAFCGDAVRQSGEGEACDDGNREAGDGCNGACEVEAGFTCTEDAEGRSSCTAL